MAKSTWKVPVHKETKRIEFDIYCTKLRHKEQYDFVDPWEFPAIMKYAGYTRNSNGTFRFQFEDIGTSITYNMTVKNFDKMVRNNVFKGIIAHGMWGFTKHGDHISIKYVGEIKTK